MTPVRLLRKKSRPEDIFAGNPELLLEQFQS